MAVSPTGKLFFVHVGKTGGTFLGRALRALERRAGIEIEYTRHKGRVPDILRDAPDSQVMFGVRDPLEIFVSGFYSRQRKGAPRYYSEWSEAETTAFETFDTANRLAEALSAEDADLRQSAQDAMKAIKHVRQNLREYLKGSKFLTENKDRIYFIFNQPTLEDDLAELYRNFDAKVPRRILDNESIKHRNPSGIDRTLSDLARANLSEHYGKDLRIHKTCLTLRQEILKRYKEQLAEAAN